MVNKRLFLALFAFFLWLPLRATGQDDYHTVCAIGDSHVSSQSFLVSQVREQLGPHYTVLARGRIGWSTHRWITAGDFGTVCGDSEIILISLGGNDIHNGVSWTRINHNLEILIAQLPSTVRLVYHMTVPRFYRPRLLMASDGIHLSFSGARTYAAILVPHIILE